MSDGLDEPVEAGDAAEEWHVLESGEICKWCD
jgi:hypothetical protein